MYQSCLLLLTTMVYKKTIITLFVFTYIAMRMHALIELISLESSISEIFLANSIRMLQNTPINESCRSCRIFNKQNIGTNIE